MGTTRIKVIDLSGEQKEIKTSRKHAEKLTGAAKFKETKKPKAKVGEKPEEKTVTESTENKLKSTELTSSPVSAPLESSEPSVIKKPSAQPASVKSVVARKSKHLRHTGKKYLVATALIDKNKIYPAAEAIDLLYKTSITRFDPTVEIHFNVTDKNVRGSVNFPHAVAVKKERKILVFSDPPAGKADKQSSISDKHIIWGNENTIADIESGKVKPNRDFDIVLAQPKFMPALAKIAKILGPAGLMPNPKNNTVVENVLSALEETASATFEYKKDPSAPIVHTKLGKLSYKPEQLTENLKALVTSIGPAKIKKATLTSTMSPPIKTDITSIQ